jgi:hypothetical protein
MIQAIKIGIKAIPRIVRDSEDRFTGSAERAPFLKRDTLTPLHDWDARHCTKRRKTEEEEDIEV